MFDVLQVECFIGFLLLCSEHAAMDQQSHGTAIQSSHCTNSNATIQAGDDILWTCGEHCSILRIWACRQEFHYDAVPLGFLLSHAAVHDPEHCRFRKSNAFLDKQFPNDPPRPSLLALEQNVSLALSFGHPMLLDGYEPTVPNYIHIGMMNCKPPKGFERGDKIGKFIEKSKNGVIYMSFGSGECL